MILVTGASGLLGLSFALTAQARDIPVGAASLSLRISIPDVPTISEDVRSPAFLSKMRELRPSSVVHCAAMTDVDGCQEHPEDAQLVNALATGAIARTASESGASFVYVSTDSVFDGARGGYAEADTPHPINVYAATKLQGEAAALKECPGSLVIRTNIFGWRARERPTLAEWIVRTLRAGETVPGFTDTFFNPILTTHVSEVILDLIAQGEQGVMHVAGRDRRSKFEFAREMAATFDLPTERVVESSLADSSLRAPRPLDTCLDVSQVESILDRRMPTLAEGLSDFRHQEFDGFVDTIKASLGDLS